MYKNVFFRNLNDALHNKLRQENSYMLGMTTSQFHSATQKKKLAKKFMLILAYPKKVWNVILIQTLAI